MKFVKFLLLGVFFGIIMAKSEAMSWFRIQEMFRFQAFHMYGIIGMAVVLGAAGVALIKRFKVKDINGNVIQYADKEPGWIKGIVGGTVFGMGWAITGACSSSGSLETSTTNSLSFWSIRSTAFFFSAAS